jgi:signal transduction histidine kinase
MTLDELHLQVAELRASRRRLVLDGDAERRGIERELHDGVQQQLVAIAMRLQLVIQAAEGASALRPLLEEMRSDVQRALDDASALAEAIYLPRLEPDALALALRRAASRAQVDATVDVQMKRRYPASVVQHVYSCCRVALDDAGPGARIALTVRDADDAIVLELVGNEESPPGDSAARLQRLRDRVGAIGGSVTVGPHRGRETHVSASIPLTG